MSSLRKDTFAYGMAIAVDRLAGFLLLPILTRLISPQDYGMWAQAGVVASMLIPLVLMAFQTALVQFFSATPEDDPVRRSLTAAMLLAIGLALSVLGMVVAVWPEAVTRLAFGVDTAAALAFPLFLLVASEAGHEFAVGHMRASGRIQRLAVYLSIKSLLRLLAPVSALVILDSGLDGVLLALAAAQMALLAVIVWREILPATLLSAGLAPGRARWAEVLSYTLPLVALAGMTMAHNFADRIFLTHLLGLQRVAVYAAVASLVGMAAVFYTVQGFTLFPALAGLWSSGQHEAAGRIATRALHFFLYCAVPLIMLLAVVSPTLLPMIATDAYHARPLVFLLLGGAVIGFGCYQILLYLVLLSGRGLSGLSAMTAAAIANIALNFALVPLAGLCGAAGAACLSNLFLALLTGRTARQGLAFAFPWREAVDIAARSLLAALCIMATGIWLDLSSPPTLVGAMMAAAMLYILPDLFRPGSPPRLLLGMS
jgi:O-antigen/teichoic acid export membrane protein